MNVCSKFIWSASPYCHEKCIQKNILGNIGFMSNLWFLSNINKELQLDIISFAKCECKLVSHLGSICGVHKKLLINVIWWNNLRMSTTIAFMLLISLNSGNTIISNCLQHTIWSTAFPFILSDPRWNDDNHKLRKLHNLWFLCNRGVWHSILDHKQLNIVV